MDASRDASVAELRRAYLKASVPRGPKFSSQDLSQEKKPLKPLSIILVG